MRILVCNERFLFRFGVDRCLLMLGNQWRKDGHEIIMMGNRMDPASVSKCSDRFIRIPDAPDYRTWNEYTLDYLREHWDEWFNESNRPDAAGGGLAFLPVHSVPAGKVRMRGRA